MMKKKLQLQIYSFYRFTKIANKEKLKSQIESFVKNRCQILRGTILVANEGINVSISGKSSDLKILLSYIKKLLRIRKCNLKINDIDLLPFNRFKVRLKKEIVSLGYEVPITKAQSGKFICPSEWDQFILNNNVLLIDARNNYEIPIGKFKNSINPETKTFREFPSQFKKLKINKEKKIAMYCTGGIRCEKASMYLNSIGYKNIFQLDGGILNYLKNNIKNKESIWKGECFVFDNRVSVDKSLKEGSYLQCFGCRRPLSSDDTKSKRYKKGICCDNCYNERTEQQIFRSVSRQKQIKIANSNKNTHTFSDIKSSDFI